MMGHWKVNILLFEMYCFILSFQSSIIVWVIFNFTIINHIMLWIQFCLNVPVTLSYAVVTKCVIIIAWLDNSNHTKSIIHNLFWERETGRHPVNCFWNSVKIPIIVLIYVTKIPWEIQLVKIIVQSKPALFTLRITEHVHNLNMI